MIPISTAAEDARSQMLYTSAEFLIRFIAASRRGFALNATRAASCGQW
jgi:hypothetical protein